MSTSSTTRLPDFLLIGPPRTGTTWLARCLAAHPQIHIPTMEVHFFDRHYDRGMEWYVAQVDGRADRPLAGEATPAYLCLDEVPGRIHRHLPHAKLVVTLRDPVERARSHYWNQRDKRNSEYCPAPTFEEEIRRVSRVISDGRYATLLKRYLEYFPREQLLVLRYEQLVQSPREYFRSALAFLGADTSIAPVLEGYRQNSSAPKVGLTRSRGLRAAQMVATRLKRHRIAGLIQRVNQLDTPPVSPDTRRMLIQEHFGAELEELERMLGWDLATWKRV